MNDNERKRRGTVLDDVVRRIRAVFDARAAVRHPSDADLVRETGLNRRVIRAIGARHLYKGVPDEGAGNNPAIQEGA